MPVRYAHVGKQARWVLVDPQAQMNLVFGAPPERTVDPQRDAIAIWLARQANQYTRLE